MQELKERKEIRPGDVIDQVIAGATIDFGGENKARLIYVGQIFIIGEMIGNKKLKPETIGNDLQIGNQNWRIVEAGRRFKLARIN